MAIHDWLEHREAGPIGDLLDHKLKLLGKPMNGGLADSDLLESIQNLSIEQRKSSQEQL